MSWIACAVLNAESGYHTPPACCTTTFSLCGIAGSAGVTLSTVRLSVAITPTGMPPSRARPVTTVRAQSARTSMKLPRSNSPDCHCPSSSAPQSRRRTS